MIIQLETWEYEWAAAVAMRRTTSNWNKQDAAHYNDKSKMEDNRTANHAATLCELAVAKATNQYWSGSAWCSHDQKKYGSVTIDVGRNIEVKRSRTKDDISIRDGQYGLGMILFVARPAAPEFKTVDIWGWIEFDKAWDLGEPVYGKNNVREINRRHLNDDPDACPRP